MFVGTTKPPEETHTLPPPSGIFSRMMTEEPASAAAIAAFEPALPYPRTTTSASRSHLISSFFEISFAVAKPTGPAITAAEAVLRKVLLELT